jgi:hypothetical protein
MLLTDDLTIKTDHELAEWHAEAKGRPEYEILAEQEWKRREKTQEHKRQSLKPWYETFIGKIIVGVMIGILVSLAGIFIGKYHNTIPRPQQFQQPQQPPSLPMDQLSLPLERGLSPTSVTVTGTVDTGTPPTRAWFEYDKNYDSLAAGDGIVMPQVAGSPFIREGRYPVEQYITKLSPNTTYYYRLVASNDYKVYETNIRQFTTPSDSAPVH